MSNPITYIGGTQLIGMASPGGTFLAIGGSDQKTVRVLSLTLSLVGSEATPFTFALTRSINRPSGGTASPINPMSLDTALGLPFNPSAYSVGFITTPSGDTPVAIGGLYTLPVSTTPSDPLELINLAPNGGFVLRGITDILTLNGLGETFTGSVTAVINTMWTEQ